MILGDATIQEDVVIASDNIIHPKVKVASTGMGGVTTIGQLNIFEEMVKIEDSSIGSGNLVEVGTHVEEVLFHISKK
jgi:hypothetical protein